MADIFDYLSWRGDLEFSKSPLNPVDYLIFSQISYLPFEGIVPGPDEGGSISIHLALSNLEEKLHNKNGKHKVKLLFHDEPFFIKTIMSSQRFKNCKLLNFVNQIDTKREFQFSAVCIYTDKSCCIAFRGTDANFIGWKEDFNMAFRDTIPSQTEAVKYIEKAAVKIDGRIELCGHSKGGNLAMYSAAFCSGEIKKRITGVYSYDAPGFNGNVIKSGEFSSVKDRIHSYIPQGSVVGMLLEHGNEHTVVKSNETGLMQHSLFSWEVIHNDLSRAEKITVGSLFIGKTIREWVDSLDNVQREKFIKAIYKILNASEMNSIHEMEDSWVTAAGRIIKSLGNIDEETRKLIFNVLAELLRSAGRNINKLIKTKMKTERN